MTCDGMEVRKCLNSKTIENCRMGIIRMDGLEKCTKLVGDALVL